MISTCDLPMVLVGGGAGKITLGLFGTL